MMKPAVVALLAGSALGYSAGPALGQDDQAQFVEVAARYVIEHDDLGKLGPGLVVDLEDGLTVPVGLVDLQPAPPDQMRSHAATAAQSLGFRLADLEDVIDCPERKRYEGPFECRLQGPVKAVVEVSMPEADSKGLLVNGPSPALSSKQTPIPDGSAGGAPELSTYVGSPTRSGSSGAHTSA